nr:MAG TPA: hypothetical protein [Caudoviricetes sp.]
MTTTNYFKNKNLYPQIHTILLINGDDGEILEEFNYNFLYWHPFIPIFEKYQKQHIKFDVIEDGEQRTRLFRQYQKTERGSWVKKPY